ncbi:nuclear transport factor 2 family protein [Candidatus Woesearchaeota archaeon]|nr:nuclear transport factor 2 family protein [Candidatus Woesearchaeota archaeon]
MNIKQITEVMRKYGKAWENQDSNLLLECFTKNGVYQESPLAKPYSGHKEIKKFWDKTVKQDTSNIKFKTGKCYVSKDGKTGFAEWQCRNTYKGKRHLMVGIMVLKMKGDKISFLNEYWNTKAY